MRISRSVSGRATSTGTSASRLTCASHPQSAEDHDVPPSGPLDHVHSRHFEHRREDRKFSLWVFGCNFKSSYFLNLPVVTTFTTLEMMVKTKGLPVEIDWGSDRDGNVSFEAGDKAFD